MPQEAGKCMQGGALEGTDGSMYSGTLAVMPFRSNLGDWFTDHVAVSSAVAALGNPLPEQLSTRDAGLQFASSAAFAGRIRSKMAHCQVAGVVCNAMGRVVHFSSRHFAPLKAGTARSDASDISKWQLPGVDDVLLDVLQLQWLVVSDFAASPVFGRIPDMQELPVSPTLVRIAQQLPGLHL
jgi:hypothetical protein